MSEEKFLKTPVDDKILGRTPESAFGFIVADPAHLVIAELPGLPSAVHLPTAGHVRMWHPVDRWIVDQAPQYGEVLVPLDQIAFQIHSDYGEVVPIARGDAIFVPGLLRYRVRAPRFVTDEGMHRGLIGLSLAGHVFPSDEVVQGETLDWSHAHLPPTQVSAVDRCTLVEGLTVAEYSAWAMNLNMWQHVVGKGMVEIPRVHSWAPQDGQWYGNHAHTSNQQIYVALDAVDIVMYDGALELEYTLLPGQVLYMPELVWHKVRAAGTSAAGPHLGMIVISSEIYDRSRYIEDWDAYLHAISD